MSLLNTAEVLKGLPLLTLLCRHGSETNQQTCLWPGLWTDPKATISSLRSTTNFSFSKEERTLSWGDPEKAGGCRGEEKGIYPLKNVIRPDLVYRITPKFAVLLCVFHSSLTHGGLHARKLLTCLKKQMSLLCFSSLQTNLIGFDAWRVCITKYRWLQTGGPSGFKCAWLLWSKWSIQSICNSCWKRVQFFWCLSVRGGCAIQTTAVSELPGLESL